MVLLPQHRLLYFFPEPHGHESFRPTLKALRCGSLVSGSPLVVQLGKTINRNRRLTAHQLETYPSTLRQQLLSWPKCVGSVPLSLATHQFGRKALPKNG